MTSYFRLELMTSYKRLTFISWNIELDLIRCITFWQFFVLKNLVFSLQNEKWEILDTVKLKSDRNIWKQTRDLEWLFYSLDIVKDDEDDRNFVNRSLYMKLKSQFGILKQDCETPIKTEYLINFILLFL